MSGKISYLDSSGLLPINHAETKGLSSGVYLNPGSEVFREVRNAEIYVDKSMLISIVNDCIDKGNKYICMSRPRRFGKTMAGNMLSAYYSKGCDSSELFKKLKISSSPGYEEKRNKYNVIKIDMNSEYQNTKNRGNLIDSLSNKVICEIMVEYPGVNISPEDNTLAEAILEVYSKTKETFIIIIDEYDVLVREQVDKDLFNRYLGFLNGLFKSDTLRPAISLAYLTGILPIVRDKVQSKLNNFDEFTLLDAGEFSEYMGFTKTEVMELCGEYDVDYNECIRWYDGYSLSYYNEKKKEEECFEVFNPESVVKAMVSHGFGSFWGKTSTYEAIAERIRQNLKGTREDVINMLAGERIEVNITRYMNTVDIFTSRDDVFTYLIHLGYLAYDRRDRTCRIPNWEIRQEWYNAIEAIDDYRETNRIIGGSKRLLEATLAGSEKTVAEALETSHIHVSSNRSYNNEDVLQSAICLAFIYALNKYTCIREMTSGKGFADVVYIPVNSNDPALIIELKHNKTAESGLLQIKEKRYFESLSHYRGDLLLVGINYDDKRKKYDCKIERFGK